MSLIFELVIDRKSDLSGYFITRVNIFDWFLSNYNWVTGAILKSKLNDLFLVNDHKVFLFDQVCDLTLWRSVQEASFAGVTASV